MWRASASRQQQTPTGPARICDTSVSPPVAVVCDRGVYLDADVSMAAHVTATVRACFAALRQIRSMRSSLPRDDVITLIHALVVSISWTNATMYWLESRQRCSDDCNQSSAPPLGWCSRPEVRHTLRHFSVNFKG